MTQHRSLLTVAAMAAGSVVLFAAPAQAQASDRDCGDFQSQPAAQRFFERQGSGDPNDLDRDNDGIACETLPGGNDNRNENNRNENNRNENNRNENNRNENNRNENNRNENNRETPQGGVEAGAGGMADPTSPALPAAGALLGTALLGAGVMAARRRAAAK